MKISQVDKKAKKIRIFLPYTQKKLAFALAIIMLALLALIGRIYFLQYTKANEYNQRILSQQRYDSIELPYKRGDITDRNGTYLAISNKVYNLIIDASQINSAPDKYLDAKEDLLVEVFGYDPKDIKKVIEQKESKENQNAA